jgi:hypothetical protein
VRDLEDQKQKAKEAREKADQARQEANELREKAAKARAEDEGSSLRSAPGVPRAPAADQAPSNDAEAIAGIWRGSDGLVYTITLAGDRLGVQQMLRDGRTRVYGGRYVPGGTSDLTWAPENPADFERTTPAWVKQVLLARRLELKVRLRVVKPGELQLLRDIARVHWNSAEKVVTRINAADRVEQITLKPVEG